jgi:glyoxylase-like metal-dependent hydrolase (beta-lactamase superfamily II)
MQELQGGVWHWTGTHPEWSLEEDGGPDGWPQEVSSYAVDTGDWFVIIDPIAPPSLLDEVASGRDPVVVLTCPWHDRDTRAVVERLGAPVYAPPRDDSASVPERVYTAGDGLPGEIVAHAAIERNDLVLWIPKVGALVFGDTLIDRGNGLEIPVTWDPQEISRDERLELLRPLLELPVRLVLPTHGPPTDRAALERALA